MKIRLENSIDPLSKTQLKTKMNLAVGSQVSRIFCCRSISRSTANGQISDRWKNRSTGWSTVDPKQRLKLSVGRPGQLTRTTESTALASGRPAGRPKCTAALWCMSIDRLVDRQSSFALPAVNRPPDRLRAKTGFLVSLQNQSFFNKFSFDK